MDERFAKRPLTSARVMGALAAASMLAACSSTPATTTSGEPTGTGGHGGVGVGGHGGQGVAGHGGQGTGAGTSSSTGTGGEPTIPSGGGAAAPFVEYEAESMETNGVVIGPSRTFTEVASEASGRRAVKLTKVGDDVHFKSTTHANSIVVRYSIPDGGNDYWVTLGVYVDGQLRGRLSLTSRYSWTYGNHDHFNQPDQNNAGLGTPHHFFDESRALIGDIPEGATVMLRKDGEDMASEYVIDLVDLEYVAPPLPKPDGFLSLTDDCGGTPNDATDDSDALQKCIDRVQGEGRPGLYLPPGEFRSISKGLSTSNITIRGAGMWHTTISGFFARFDCWGNNCQYYDFSVFGDTIQRKDDSPENAFGGNGSSGTRLENIWIEHAKVGYWTGPDTNGLTITHCRMRNLFADGVNFFGGTSNSLVEYTHARNTGDDAFASWSPADHAPNRKNVFQNNLVQVPWMANCFGIYGGEDTVVQDNVCADVVQYPGILIARQFNSTPFTGTTHIDRNSLIRAGGSAYDQPHGALKLHAAQGPLQNLRIGDLEVIDPTYSGIHVEGPGTIDSVWFDKATIKQPKTAAFHLSPNATGAMDAANVAVTNAPQGVLDESGGKFKILVGAGNTGW
ncbi:secreted protein [Minicystis rosea]|nr:secreted protein [Minicystis rosea]